MSDELEGIRAQPYRDGDVVILQLKRHMEPSEVDFMKDRLERLTGKTGVHFLILAQDVEVVSA